ncbi:hypothetical protein ACFL5H_00540 [Candidatus Latescibacterota bacterium]
MAAAGVAVSVSLYALGVYIISGLGLFAIILYLIYCVSVEISILRRSCIHCTYYGNLCGLGRGKLCALLFRRGNPQWFGERQVSWKDILPDLIMPLIPLAGGIFLLTRQFDWAVACAMVLVILVTIFGNAAVRGSLACKYCKQRELGCPAERLFRKERAESTS